MDRVFTVFCCALGLAVAGVPAGASPTDKRLTLTCSVPTGSSDIISGGATVTLCDSSSVNGESQTCIGQSHQCASTPIYCDSGNKTAPISITVSCSAPFRVGGMIAEMEYSDSDRKSGSSTYASTLGGQGVSFYYGNPSDYDTVALTIR